MKIIQIGMGGWGRNWYRSHLSQFRGVTVAAVVDRSEEALELTRKDLAVPAEACFRSLGTAIEKTKAEAAVVTANLPGHVPICREALSAGLHVLVEKPFAPRVKDARMLVDLAARQGRVLMVSQNYRFFPAVRTVEQLLRSNKLGRLTTISLDFRKYANSAQKEGHKHYFIDHPMLMDMAIHHYDLLRLIADEEPQEVYCRTSNPPWSKFDNPPAAFALMKYASGLAVSYRGSWISHRGDTSWAGEWAIECEHGAVSWESRGSEDGREDRVTLWQLGKPGKKVALKKVKHLDRSGALDAFVSAVKSGAEPECSGRDNIGTLEMMHAMVKSASTGKPVRL